MRYTVYIKILVSVQYSLSAVTQSPGTRIGIRTGKMVSEHLLQLSGCKTSNESVSGVVTHISSTQRFIINSTQLNKAVLIDKQTSGTTAAVTLELIFLFLTNGQNVYI